MTSITIGLNIEFFALILLGIFVVYLLGIIYVNTYTNFSAKDIGRMMVVMYMLGVLTVAYLVGSKIFILLSFAIAILFVVFSLLKMRKKVKQKKNSASRINNNGGN